MTHTCIHCKEPVSPGDPVSPSLVNGQLVHHECGFRMACGSAAHIERRCGCYVSGSDENDAPELTRREAAKAALAAWHRQQPAREHVQWCKQRALEYAKRGELGNALNSLASDLGKHPDTAGERYAQVVRLGMSLMLSGQLSTNQAMREFIEEID